MLSKISGKLSLTHISLTMVGLMWVLPFLHYQHAYPLTTFYQEWWAAVLGLFAMVALLGREYWLAPSVPKVIMLPLALIAVALLQLAAAKIAYFEQGMLYILYLLFAALLMQLGAALRQSLGLEKVAIFLAAALLLGAELGAAIGIYQHFGWHGWLDYVVVRKISAGLYGNLAQPNHYADYIMLGLASLGLLYQQRKMALGYVVALVLPLLFVLTLSGSRSSWLYMIAAALLAAWMVFKDGTLRPLLYYMLAVIFAYMVMHGILQFDVTTGQGGLETNSLRASDTSGNIRLYLWQEAVRIFFQSPFLGVGFGQFAFHHFELQPELQPLLKPSDVSGLYNNAHNVVLQLAAETGLAGILTLFVTGTLWLYGQYQAKKSAAHWWCYALLATIGIHALLEYPLWYAYFIAILSFVLGLADEGTFPMTRSKMARIGLALLLILGVWSMQKLNYSYIQLKVALTARTTAEKGGVTCPIESLVGIRNDSFLLKPYIDLFISNCMSMDGQELKKKLEFNTNVLKFIPIAEVAFRQSFLLAKQGRTAEAEVAMTKALWSYPNNPNDLRVIGRLAEKDPAHFSALLEFAVQKEQEIARAVRNK